MSLDHESRSNRINEPVPDIMLCKEHSPRCNVDYADMNCDVQRSSRIEDTNGKGKKQMQAVRSYLPLDIPVRVLGRSGRDIRKYLYGIIGGLMIETDKESWYCGDECYVIDCRDNVSFTYPVLCVHDEFQVRLIDGSYMPAKEWLKRCQL